MTAPHQARSGRLWIVDAYVIVYSALLVVGGTIGRPPRTAWTGPAPSWAAPASP